MRSLIRSKVESIEAAVAQATYDFTGGGRFTAFLPTGCRPLEQFSRPWSQARQFANRAVVAFRTPP
jgi:hypothetical protein